MTKNTLIAVVLASIFASPALISGGEMQDTSDRSRLDDLSLLISDGSRFVPKDHYPRFTWDRIPLYMHIRKAKSYTDEEIAFLARFPLITFEKANGHQDYGSVEAGTLIAARAVKEINPEAKILYYRNVMVHYGGYAANKGLGQIPGALLKDENGRTRLVRNRVEAYDLSNADLRTWWVNSCSSMTADPHIDGIFIDGNVKALEPGYLTRQISAAKKKQTMDGYHLMMKQTREAIGPDELMIANILRARFENAGLDYLDYFDGSYLEGFFHNVGGAGDIKPVPWMWATDLSGGWFYRKNAVNRMSIPVMVGNAVDAISKNGIVMLNIALRGDGTMPENQAAYLTAFGDFLKINGEGIYGTRPWKSFGEGSLKVKDGRQGENHKDFSQDDIRFTTKDGVLYAFVLAPPTKDIAIKTVTVTHFALQGIGVEKGVMRRDPSDIIKVGDLYYVWYSKGKISPGYDGTVWYATSPDGHVWTEKGLALAKGEPGSWEGASVFTPNILVAEGKYWLFYTGVSKEYERPYNPDSKIGIAVSDSPDGPWERLATNPALKNSDNPDDFDSHLVDDACLIVREGKYWFYYKGRQLGKSPAETQMGLAIADHPQGPYVKHDANPVIPGNHEVLVWPQGTGVAVMIGTTGPKDISNTIQYAEDGIHFSKTHDVKNGPWAGGAYRPEAFTQSGTGTIPQWGVEIGRSQGKNKGRLPFIQRFDVKEAK